MAARCLLTGDGSFYQWKNNMIEQTLVGFYRAQAIVDQVRTRLGPKASGRPIFRSAPQPVTWRKTTQQRQKNRRRASGHGFSAPACLMRSANAIPSVSAMA